MSLIVENGNGIENANSYASVEDFKAFAALRVGVKVPDTDDELTAPLATATGWIDSMFAKAFVGGQIFAQQALEWPRTGLVGPGGVARPLGYLPPQLVKATCILAVECLKGDPLYKNADGAARQIVEDSIGPIIKKYAPSDPKTVTLERQFPEVRQVLSPLLRTFGSLRVDR